MGSPPISRFDFLEELESCFRTQESRVRRMLFKERVTGKLCSHGWRDIQVLVQIIDKINAPKQFVRNAPEAPPPPAECTPLSPLAEQVNQLSEVDRHQLRDFGDKFIKLIQNQGLGDTNVKEDVEIKPGTEKSETPEGD